MKTTFTDTEKTARKKQVMEFWQEGKDNQDKTKYNERKNRAFDFYKSIQWDSKDKKTLEEEERPVLVFNYIKSIIRNLCGYQRDNKQSVKIFARKDAIGILAEIFSEVIKCIEDGCNAVYEKAFAFFYGTIGGKGWLSIDVRYDDDPINGDWVIQCEDPDGIVEDPLGKAYDMNKDHRFVFRYTWYEKEQLELEYPDVDFANIDKTTLDMDDKEIIHGSGDTYRDGEASASIPDERTRYRVKECQWKTWQNKRFLVNTQTLDVTDISRFNWKKGNLKAKLQEILATNPYLKEVNRVVPVLNITTMVGSQVLQDIEDPFNGFSRFLIVRYSPDWILGYAKGEVEDLEDPQQETNKRYSQALHHLNRNANSGRISDADAFGGPNQSTWDEVAQFGSKAGAHLRKKPGAYSEQIQPSQLSDGHLTLARMGPDNMKRISGVNPDMLGEVSDSNVSGIAMERRTGQGMITTRVIHDNWAYTEIILGQTILELLRKTDIVSGDEIVAMVQEKHLKFNNQEISPDQILSVLQKRRVGKYGVNVGLSPSSPTAKLQNFSTLVDAVKNGIPIPPDLLIKNSPLAEGDKEQALAYIQEQIAQRQQGQPIPGGK